MLFLDVDCKTLVPIIKLLKFGIIPVIQAAIIVILIVLLIIDLGKAVMAGKEDEIKTAQKLAIKRVVYALAVFLVPWIVNVAITVVANNASEALEDNPETAYGCWAYTKRSGYIPPNTTINCADFNNLKQQCIDNNCNYDDTNDQCY